ncbi:MAG: ParB/RepB/Spo0J family partition protein [Chloroflexi bacterium]|nr:ParB/RepB/Spo0J family partition protein [Chloroflexota bacterium]
MKIEFKSQDSKLVKLHVADIVPDKNQPRKNIDTEMIKELARSIAETGQIGPIVVRSLKNGKYLIVVGERRWRAAIEAGLQYVDCIVRVDIDDRKALEMQLAENYQREDIPPLDQARAFKTYIDKYEVSQRELSRRTGIPQRTISSRLALLLLPVSMRAQLEAGHIGPHEALMISSFPPSHQDTVLSLVASGKLGGRALKSLCTLSKAEPNVTIDELIQQMEYGSFELSLRTTRVRAPVDSVTPSPNSGKGKSPLSASEWRDLKDLIIVARAIGAKKHEGCECLEDDGRCGYWGWESRESIPEGIGDEAVHPKKDGEWFIKPSILFCAMCSSEALHIAFMTRWKLDHDPLADLQREFTCDCGATGKVAACIKCTECNKETWLGWWPE